MSPPASQQGDSEQLKVKKPRLKLSYEEYKQMANLLVLHMRRIEDTVTDGKLTISFLIENMQTIYSKTLLTDTFWDCPN